MNYILLASEETTSGGDGTQAAPAEGQNNKAGQAAEGKSAQGTETTEATTTAQTTAPGGKQQQIPQCGEGMGSMLVLFGIMALIFYFMLIRPQKKKEKDHQSMVDNLKKNDTVVTIGGIHGIVDKVKKDKGEIDVKVDDNTRMTFSLRAIQVVKPKGGQDTGSSGDNS